MNNFGNSSSSIIGSRFYVSGCQAVSGIIVTELITVYLYGTPEGSLWGFPVGNAEVIKVHYLRGFAVVVLQHSGPPCLC